jgi:hypothetical protein
MKKLTQSGILLGIALIALAFATSILTFKISSNHSKAEKPEIRATP